MMPNKKKQQVSKQPSVMAKDIGAKMVSLLRRTDSKKEKDAKRYAHKVQLVVLGARNVGKSSILSQYLFHRFDTQYRPTVDDYYVQMVQMEDGTYRNLHLIDTAGPHDFPAMQRLWIQQSSSFVVVYSVCEPLSFSMAASILQQIHQEKEHEKKKPGKEFHIVLVGNKADLIPQDKDRRVPRQAVRDLSARYSCLYIETSAKHGLNVDSLFRCLLMKEVPPQLSQFFPRRQDREGRPGGAVEAEGGRGGGAGGGGGGRDVVKPSLFCARQK
ncbi:ras-related protein Rap1-like [Babylonia areolata]|uniref:ras-related protein Rap1-like n=1 Tax=Babylonia areolata TaxID=304850 RepID=UPI003FD65648